MSSSSEEIPNNVDLSSDRKLQKALASWRPDYLAWWNEVGPAGFQADQIYLRTAVSVEPGGWAHFDYVRMPEYRWGIFLNPEIKGTTIGFGDHVGAPVWTEVPGEFRKDLRRIVVTQGDTEPASVEQQRLLGKTAPSLYDLRNLFQVNVEEGRHLWAMVYLLHKYFGKDGRDEADDLLARRSGHADSPRMLSAFNKPVRDWLAFFCFTTFTDRDGKYQLGALAESAFDPLARTCQFMLTEEAHHMFVGETGVSRVIQRTAELMKQGSSEDVADQGAIPLEIVQKYIDEWFSASMDLFGGEDSSNAATFFSGGLKGRFKERRDQQITDHRALEGSYEYEVPAGGSDSLQTTHIPLRRAMNLVLRDAYLVDCERVISRWNRVLERADVSFRVRLPHERFNRAQGVFSGLRFDVNGQRLSEAEWQARKHEWLPTEADYALVASCMTPCHEQGKIANWIAKPARGINDNPFEHDYVRFA